MPNPTPKQALRAHLEERHQAVARIMPRRITFAAMQKIHAREHHRKTLSHYHGDSPRGTGADDRPAGWYTGLDVVERSGASS